MISRGLLISLVVTGVSTACLLIYFKNRMGDVEKKVDLMFDFIQDHEQRQLVQKQQDDITVSFNSNNNQEMDVSTIEKSQQDLIQVSDDEESGDESDEDSEDESDEDNGVISGEEIVLEAPEELKQLEQVTNTNGDLSELNEVQEVKVEETGTISLQKKEEDSLDELSDGEDSSSDEELEKEEEEEEKEKTDYNKLTVAVLKEVANKKGLQGYKSLKKAALIKLIEDN